VVAITGIASVNAAPPSGTLPDRVTFASADGHTTLVGYIFKPEGSHPARTPAVIMMHGRAGAYSSLANGHYDATTLSKRHQEWGHIWAQQGYLAILVDGFGPRGFPHGFPRFSYDTRPDALNEVTVRPLDAYGALAYLRTRDDVVADRVALQDGPMVAALRWRPCPVPRPASHRRRRPPAFGPGWCFTLRAD
jgi:hypothetical protein